MKTDTTFTVPNEWDGKQHGKAAVVTKSSFPCIGRRCWSNPNGPWHDKGTEAYPYQDVKYRGTDVVSSDVLGFVLGLRLGSPDRFELSLALGLALGFLLGISDRWVG